VSTRVRTAVRAATRTPRAAGYPTDSDNDSSPHTPSLIVASGGDAQEEAERDCTLTQMQGLSTQKKLSLYATAIVPVHSHRNLNAVPSTVAYRVYQYLTDLLDADEKSRDSYLRYMSEAETYNFVTSKKRGRGYGSGVHKEYTFVDDPEVVSKTLEADIRIEEIEHDKNLVKSVVNAQVDDFFEGD